MSNDARSFRHTKWKYHQAIKVLRFHPKFLDGEVALNSVVAATRDIYQDAEGDEKHGGPTQIIFKADATEDELSRTRNYSTVEEGFNANNTALRTMQPRSPFIRSNKYVTGQRPLGHKSAKRIM